MLMLTCGIYGYMLKPLRAVSGFTIVELLIVIAVIGILAGITLVAYNNVQERASNSRTVTMVSSYAEALSVYLALHRTYPPMDEDAGGVCLGVGYRDRVGSDGIGDCGETSWHLNEDLAFNNSLKRIISSLPVVNDRPIKMPYQPTQYVGAAFHYFPPDPTEPLPEDRNGFIVDGVSSPYYIMYVLEGGDQNCSLSDVVATDESQGGWPVMTKNMPNGQSWSYSDGKTTACAVTMPNVSGP